MLELAELFYSEGIEVNFLLNGRGEVASELDASGSLAEYVDFQDYASWKQPFSFLSKVLKIRSFFKERRTEVCVVEGKVLTQIFGLAGRLSGTKVLSYVHFPPSEWEAKRVLYKLCFKVVLCCENLKKYFKLSKVADSKFVTIRNYIDTDKYSVSAPRRNSKSIRLVSVGHLSAVKGQELLIEVFSEVLARHPDLELTLAGADNSSDQANLKRIKTLVSKLGLEDKVNIAGKVKDMVELYAESDIFVLPSLKEGLPLVVLEAMSCGLPVVATAVDGTPEAVEQGETGILLQLKNEECDREQLRQALNDLIEDSDLRLRMGEAGKLKVRSEFTQAIYQKQFLELIEASIG